MKIYELNYTFLTSLFFSFFCIKTKFKIKIEKKIQFSILSHFYTILKVPISCTLYIVNNRVVHTIYSGSVLAAGVMTNDKTKKTNILYYIVRNTVYVRPQASDKENHYGDEQVSLCRRRCSNDPSVLCTTSQLDFEFCTGQLYKDIRRI